MFISLLYNNDLSLKTLYKSTIMFIEMEEVVSALALVVDEVVAYREDQIPFHVVVVVPCVDHPKGHGFRIPSYQKVVWVVHHVHLVAVVI